MPRLTDRSFLHPVLRSALIELDWRLAAENLPLRLYEAARMPWRQAELYALGRTTGERGETRTDARAWSSFHQYGCAADYVFWHGGWSWAEPRPGAWKLFHEIARDLDLRPLSKEQPHVELPLRLEDLQAGHFPAGGDSAWRDWLEGSAEVWGSAPRSISDIVQPGAPPGLLTVAQRPPFTAAP